MEINPDILSKLPIDIITSIITEYTGHFRVEINGRKNRLIPLISQERKEQFEKLHNTIPKPVAKVHGILSNNPILSVQIILPSKDEMTSKSYENVEYCLNYVEDYPNSILRIAPGIMRKYHIITKVFSLSATFNMDPWLSDIRSSAFLIKHNNEYFIPVNDSRNNTRDCKAILCYDLSRQALDGSGMIGWTGGW